MSTLPDIDALSLQELVAQTIVVRASGYLYDRQIQSEIPCVFSYGQQPEAQQAVMQALGLK